MQRSLCYLWKWKEWLLKHTLYYYGNLCTATQSTVREIYDFFMQKSTQISFDDMESFS